LQAGETRRRQARYGIPMSDLGTQEPVSVVQEISSYQGVSCHWMQVWLLCVQELPLWMPGIFGSN